MPWMMRPANSQPMFGAIAATTEPTAVISIMITRMRLRPTTSESRGRNREKSAAVVKNQVCDRPIAAWLVFSSSPMVTSAGLSMEALSWKATQAVSRAAVRAAVPPRVMVPLSITVLMRPRPRP